jgi:hypothetical protein
MVTRIVYVELLDEGVEVWRPVEAVDDGDTFVLPVTAPEGEHWAFSPGSRVRCELELVVARREAQHARADRRAAYERRLVEAVEAPAVRAGP